MKTTIAIAFVVVIFIVANLLNRDEKKESFTDWTETMEASKSVQVRGSFFAVSVQAEERTDMEMKVEFKSMTDADKVKVLHEKRGETLYVWVEKQGIFSSVSGKILLSVPVTTNVNIENGSGSIRVSGIQCDEVTLISGSGSIWAEDIQSPLRAVSGSGAISLNQITGSVNATAASGGVRISRIKGELKCKTASGGQSLSMVEGDVESNAASGGVRAESIQGDLSIKTASGSIRLNNTQGAVDLVSVSGSQKGEDVELKGNSSFRASSGSIHMTLTNDKDELNFNLSSSSGRLTAFDSSGNDRLIVGNGAINIEANSTSGSISFR